MSKSIIKSSIMLMTLSLLSKLLALGKEMAMAYFYGATSITDAYVVAVSATNLILEGLVACTVMSLVRSIADQRDDKESITQTINTVLLLLCGLALVFTVGILLAPELFVRLFASGFDADTVATARTILLAMLPILVIRAFYSVMNGYLESTEDFVIRGFGETVINVCVLLAIVFSRGRLWILGTGWVVGQAIICMLAYLRARGNGLKLLKCKPKPMNDPAIRALMAMALPLFLGSLFNELNPIIDRNFASSLGEGVVSALNYSTRITKLFHQLFVVSVTTVLFPRLSKLAVDGSMEEYKQTATKMQSCLQLIAIPITVGIAILAQPLVEMLFLRGSFDATAVEITAKSLRIYACYIPFFTILSVYWPCFYALKDTKGPVISGVVMVTVNIAVNFLLVQLLGYQGLALATVLANLCGMLCCVILLRKKIGALGLKSFAVNMGKMCIAAAVMGGVVYFLRNPLLSLVAGMTSFLRIVILALLALIGASVYAVAAKLLHIRELEEVLSVIVCKLTKKRSRNI